MYLTHVRHMVKDYSQWRAAFDANIPMLKAAGVIDIFIICVEENSHDVAVINTWPDKQSWDNFLASHGKNANASLEESKAKGGLIGEPEFWGGEMM